MRPPLIFKTVVRSVTLMIPRINAADRREKQVFHPRVTIALIYCEILLGHANQYTDTAKLLVQLSK